jgi:hypothetical protein
LSATGSPGRTRRLGRIVLITALVLGPLIAGELVVRALIAADRLPPAAAHFRPVDVMWLNLERAGRPDVLLLGDSMTHSGIDPAVLGELASKAVGREVSSYGLAIPGSGPATSLLMLEQLAREGRLPEVAVLGISPPNLRGNPGGDAAFARSPMGQLFAQCDGVEGYAEIVDCAIGQLSALWQWRGRPEQIVRALRRPVSTLGGRGSERILRRDGFSERKGRSVTELEAQVADGLDREDPTIALGEGVSDHYRVLVDFLRAHGIEVVATLVPYSPTYAEALEARHPGFEQERGAAAGQLAREIGLEIIDPGRFGSWWGDGDSSNIKHLSGEGAAEFTRQLWQTTAFRDGVLAGLEQPPESPPPP